MLVVGDGSGAFAILVVGVMVGMAVNVPNSLTSKSPLVQWVFSTTSSTLSGVISFPSLSVKTASYNCPAGRCAVNS